MFITYTVYYYCIEAPTVFCRILENEPSTSTVSSFSAEQQSSAADDDEEVLDLSTKRRKVSPNCSFTDDSVTKCNKDSQRKPTNYVNKQPPQTLTLPIYHHQHHGHTVGGQQFFPQLAGTMFFPQTQTLPPSTVASSFKNVLCQSVSQNDALSKLSNLVSKVGKTQLPAGGNAMQEAVIGSNNGLNFQELWWRFVKKEENAELKRLNEAKQIFTCLQCQASFQTMDQLVKHMETTQHYANIPKHYRYE